MIAIMDATRGGLASATALEPDGDDLWHASISPLFGGPVPGFAFGGYLAALMLRAAGEATELSVPISFTIHYLQPVRLGSELDISLVRRSGGRRIASVVLSAEVDGAHSLDAMAWVGEAVDGPDHSFGRAPLVDGPDGLTRHDEIISASGRRPPSTMLQWEKRLSVERPSLSSAAEPDPVYREWSRVAMPSRRDLFQEAARYVMPIDANPWQAARHARGLLAQDRIDYLMPTLELTAHFHQFAPDSDWLMHETVAPVAANGYCTGVTRVWSDGGALLASGLSSVTFRPV
jgi:acyl-CoA thioesterase